MEKILHKIDILPARFIRFNEDGSSVIRVLFADNHIEDRKFDKWAVEKIENPNYLLIGIMTGEGFMQCNTCDANEFESYFKSKWTALL